MKRILVAECKQEISSFNPLLGCYEDFSITRAGEILSCHHEMRSEMAGALTVFNRDSNVEVVAGYSARGVTSGGTLSDAAFRKIMSEFLDSVGSAGPIDGIYFALHGAMASETEPDDIFTGSGVLRCVCEIF